jgi:hypothetical protein
MLPVVREVDLVSSLCFSFSWLFGLGFELFVMLVMSQYSFSLER